MLSVAGGSNAGRTVAGGGINADIKAREKHPGIPGGRRFPVLGQGHCSESPPGEGAGERAKENACVSTKSKVAAKATAQRAL